MNNEAQKTADEIASIKNKIEQIKSKMKSEMHRLHTQSESQLCNLNNVDIK